MNHVLGVDQIENLTTEIDGIFETIDFLGILVIENNKILKCNDYILGLLGMTREELLNREVLDIIAPDYRSVFLKSLADGSLINEEVYVTNGEKAIPVEIRYRSWQTQKSIDLLFLRDLSLKYRNLQEKDDLETRLNTLIRRSAIEYYTLELNGEFKHSFSSDNAQAVLLKKSIFNIAQPIYHRRIERSLNTIKENPEEISLEFIDFNNQYHYATFIPIIADNSVSEIMMSDINFSELVQSEIQITSSEMRIRNMLDLAPFGIIVVQSNEIKFINQTVLKLFGYELPEEIYDLDLKEFIEDNESNRVITIEVNRLLGNDNSPRIYETIGKRKDKSHFPIRLFSTKILYFDKRSVMIFIEDLSEIKQFEEEKRVLKLQLERSQKLESLGILAGGIAHDFNNLLHAIMGNVTLATMEVSSEKSVLNYLSEIEKITRSAGDLAHQMLAYSGRGKFFVEPFNLNEFIVEMEDLLALSSKNHAKIEFIRYPLDLIIEGDKSQIQQIILNLVTNASDSNLDDEIIVIRTGLTSLSRNDITSKYHGMKPEEFDDTIKYVTLEVEDRGHGIDEDKIELIFDPFYTTKFTGRGLGLAVVLGVVIAHKGLIHVNTKRGVGTSFTVYLPQSLKQIEETKMSTEEKKQNSGTILVCDDDDAVRRVTKLMLQRIGYQVIDVATGNDAVETFKSNDNIDYVLADLTMPGMDGVELCEALRKLDPEVKVVLSSGYSQAELSKKYSEHGFMAFLQKPYSIKHLQEIFH